MLRLIAGEVALLAMGGVIAGLAGVMALARVLPTTLSGVAVTGPLACGASVAALLAVGILAAAGLAMHPSRVDPITVTAA